MQQRDDEVTGAQTAEQLAAHVRDAIARARLSGHPLDAVWALSQLHSLAIAVILEAENIPRDKPFGYYGDGPPTKQDVVFLPPRPPRFSPVQKIAPRLDVALLAQATRQRPRERRARRTARTSGSRGDPPDSESDPLEPPPAKGAA